MLNLTPTEHDRLLIFLAAELARRRRSKGLTLNAAEATAYITDELLEGAREGRSVAELVSFGATLLTTDDVLPGVDALVSLISVEGMFAEGTKLITVYTPIRPVEAQSAEASATDEPRPDEPRPGEIIAQAGDIELNAGRETVTLAVTNTGDRAIQVTSHFHFFEANKALDFPRERAFGLRLDVPAGGSIRFEPGVKKEISLVQIGGSGEVMGLNNLTQGSIHAPEVKRAALERARAQGFKGA